MKEERRDFILEHGVACMVNNVATTAVIGKVNRKGGIFSWENERQGTFLPEVTLPNGALVENIAISEFYLIRSIYPELAGGEVAARVAQMLKLNATVTIQRQTPAYDDYGNVTGVTWPDHATNVKAFIEVVTQAMRQTDPGLLPSTVARLYIQNSNPLQVLDRVVFDKNYQVDAIDSFQSPGLFVAQLSLDSRR